MPFVPPGSTVLVTGSAGFHGAWVARALLEAGYVVWGQAHSESTGVHLRHLFSRFGSSFETVIIEDLTQGDVFNHFLENVDAIVHTDSDDVRSVESLFASAIRFGPVIKRIVFLSTATAITSTPRADKIFTEEDWNEVAVKPSEGLAKDVSKTLAEKVAWELYQSNRRSVKWDLTVLNPPCVIGPTLHEVNTVEELPSSCSAWYKRVIKSTNRGEDMLISNFAWVDVRDLALAHVAALGQEDAGSERIIVSAGSFAWQDWVEAVKRVGPLVGLAYPRERYLGYDPLTIVHQLKFDNSKRERILAMRLRTMDETAADMLVDFIAREWIPLGSVELIMLECLIGSQISHV